MSNQSNITFEMSKENAAAILHTLGNLPTASGAFQLWSELNKQFEEQVKNEEVATPANPAE